MRYVLVMGFNSRYYIFDVTRDSEVYVFASDEWQECNHDVQHYLDKPHFKMIARSADFDKLALIKEYL